MVMGTGGAKGSSSNGGITTSAAATTPTRPPQGGGGHCYPLGGTAGNGTHDSNLEPPSEGTIV